MTRMRDRLHRLIARICTPAAMERRVEPTLADWSHEYLGAVNAGARWRARWVVVAGTVTVLAVVGLMTVDRAYRAVVRPDASTRAAVTTSLWIFVAVVSLATVVFAWVPFSPTPPLRALRAQDLLLLVPQALPMAIPLALVAATVVGLRGRLSAEIGILVLTGALMCSVVSFTTLAWVAPASNQVFRSRVLGFDPTKGDRELTLGEVRERIEAIRAFDPAAPARRLSVNYHVRWAYSWTPLAVVLFGLAASRRLHRLLTRSVVTSIACGLWLLLVLTGTSLAYRGTFAPALGAWLPNLTFICLAGILLLRPARDCHRLAA